MLFALGTFAALGVWQVKRLHWKHALIARVNARVHAAPSRLPSHARLASAEPGTLDYLRVKVSGTYAAPQTALVRAATGLGTGYWTMTPLRMADGRTVWINRGFLPAGTTPAQAALTAPEGPVTVIGLVRRDEPGGSLLQSNRPQDGRWYSRDLAALSQAKHTGPAAPVFIDAQTEAASAPAAAKTAPVPGLTVIRFPDSHLQYALTWFAMAVLSAVGIGVVWRRRA